MLRTIARRIIAAISDGPAKGDHHKVDSDLNEGNQYRRSLTAKEIAEISVYKLGGV
jgi:hypothetical protein